MKLSFSKNFFNNRKRKGFTLIELLVVISIIALFSTSLLLNLSRKKTDFAKDVNQIISTIRVAEDKAIATTQYNSPQGIKIPCGYGVHYIDATHYAIYVTFPSAPGLPGSTCSNISKNYVNDPQTSALVKTEQLNNNITFAKTFKDIFFEPPDPKIYINNQYLYNQFSTPIVINVEGNSNTFLKIINVYRTGKIEVQ
jgi:prepilin-type N-terminal cleavage/methylation domain-containing protein